VERFEFVESGSSLRRKGDDFDGPPHDGATSAATIESMASRLRRVFVSGEFRVSWVVFCLWGEPGGEMVVFTGSRWRAFPSRGGGDL